MCVRVQARAKRSNGRMLYADVGEAFLMHDESTRSRVVNTTLMQDALHPNTQGLEIIAQNLAPLVEKLIQVGVYPSTSEGPRWMRKQFLEVEDTAPRFKKRPGHRGNRHARAGKKRRKGGKKRGGKSKRKVQKEGTRMMVL